MNKSLSLTDALRMMRAIRTQTGILFNNLDYSNGNTGTTRSIVILTERVSDVISRLEEQLEPNYDPNGPFERTII